MTEKSIDIANGSGNDDEVGPKTSVIDTLTGGGVTYQDIKVTGANGDPQPPAVLQAAKGTSPTTRQLDAMPTSPAELRAFLLAQAKQQLTQAYAWEAQQAKKAGKKIPAKLPTGPAPTDNDLVFEQAADLLWEPNLSPALRAALYKVLADTPGVQVKTGATDSSGRPAVEISRDRPGRQGEGRDVREPEDRRHARVRLGRAVRRAPRGPVPVDQLHEPHPGQPVPGLSGPAASAIGPSAVNRGSLDALMNPAILAPVAGPRFSRSRGARRCPPGVTSPIDCWRSARVPDAELLIGAGQMSFHGLDGDKQRLGQLAVGQSRGGQLGDPALGRGKRARAGDRRPARPQSERAQFMAGRPDQPGGAHPVG